MEGLGTYLGPAQQAKFLEIAWFLFHITDDYYDVPRNASCFLTHASVTGSINILAQVNYQYSSNGIKYQCPEAEDI